MPASVSYQREKFAAAWPEIERLTDGHWREVAHRDSTAPNLNLDMFRDACDAGRLAMFTARIGAELVGYCAFWVGPVPQHNGEFGAWQEAVYATPAARKLGVGISLLRYCESVLKAIGVSVVYQFVREAHDFGPVLKCLGFTKVETTYAKRLA